MTEELMSIKLCTGDCCWNSTHFLGTVGKCEFPFEDAIIIPAWLNRPIACYVKRV